MHYPLWLLPLLGLALFIILPWWLALPLNVPLWAIALLGYWKGWQAQRRPPVTGRRAMIGGWAEVVRVESGEALVHYQGELWRAISPQSLHPGEQVMIEDVERLTLHVRPLASGSDGSQDEKVG